GRASGSPRFASHLRLPEFASLVPDYQENVFSHAGATALASNLAGSFCDNGRSAGMANRGIFITFEGTDGSGKTTQMRRLSKRLAAAGRTVIETAEPGGTAVGSKIRAILLDSANRELSPTAELLLYFAARAQNVDQVIQP